MIPLNAYPAYRFGGRLRLRFITHDLRPQLREIIMQFEKKRGDLVTRDELIETIKSIMRDENDLRRINLAGS